MIRYLYDGTFEGLMTLLYKTYYIGMPDCISILDKAQNSNIFENLNIHTDLEIYKKVCNEIENQISIHILKIIYKAYLSDKREIDIDIIRYIRKGFKIGSSIEHELDDISILRVNKFARRVGFETTRLKGFIRFIEGENYLLAKITPEHDILILLLEYFSNRLANENWIIWDTKRNKILIGNNGEINIRKVDLEAEILKEFCIERKKFYI